MPAFNIPSEAYQAATEEGEREVKPNPEMTNPELDAAIKALMEPEKMPMGPEFLKVKENSVESAQEKSKGLIEAFKANLAIRRIVNSQLFVPAAGFVVALISNEISEWAHTQGEAVLAQVYDPLFDMMSGDPDIWWDYFTGRDFANEAADYAAIMRGTQLISIAGVGAGIISLGRSVLGRIRLGGKENQSDENK